MTHTHKKIHPNHVTRAEDAASMCKDSHAGYGACVLAADGHRVHRDVNGYGWEHEGQETNR